MCVAPEIFQRERGLGITAHQPLTLGIAAESSKGEAVSASALLPEELWTLAMKTIFRAKTRALSSLAIINVWIAAEKKVEADEIQ